MGGLGILATAGQQRSAGTAGRGRGDSNRAQWWWVLDPQLSQVSHRLWTVGEEREGHRRALRLAGGVADATPSRPQGRTQAPPSLRGHPCRPPPEEGACAPPPKTALLMASLPGDPRLPTPPPAFPGYSLQKRNGTWDRWTWPVDSRGIWKEAFSLSPGPSPSLKSQLYRYTPPHRPGLSPWAGLRHG